METKLFSLTEKGVDVPTKIHAKWRKKRKDWIIICPNGHGEDKVSEQRLKYAGREKAPGLKTSPSFYAIADSLLFLGLWESGVTIFDKRTGSYTEYRTAMAIANKNVPPRDGIAFSGDTNLLLNCGCRVRVTFGTPGTKMHPEPDLVEAFLKLGMKKEIDARWMRFHEYGDTPRPLSFGRKKADELYTFVRDLQDEKGEIERAAERILEITNEMTSRTAFGTTFGSDIRSTVDREKTKRLKEIRKISYGSLKELDETFIRVALRPGSIVRNLKQYLTNLKERITGPKGSVIIVNPEEEGEEEVEIETWSDD